MTEHAPSPAHEVPKPKEVKDVLKAKGPRAALYGRLLTATPESLNPSTLNLAEPADIKTLAERDYTMLQTMSVHERRDTATVPADQLDAKVTDWVNAQAQNISKDFTRTTMDPTKAARWNQFFHHFAADEDAAKVFLKDCYTHFCAVGTTPPNAGVKGFVVYLMDHVDHKELAANLDAVEHLAGMFGAETSHVVRAQVEAELVLLTQGEPLKKELKSKPLLGNHGIRINRLEPAEAALLTTIDTWVNKKPPEAVPAPKTEVAKTPEQRVAELAKKYRELAARMVANLRASDSTVTVDGPYKGMLYNSKFGLDAGYDPTSKFFSDALQDALHAKFGVDSMFMITRNPAAPSEPVEKHAKAVFSLPYKKGATWYVKTWDPASPTVPSTGKVGFVETPLINSDYSAFIDASGRIDRNAKDLGGKTFLERLWNDDVFISGSTFKLIKDGLIFNTRQYDLTAAFDQKGIDPVMKQRMMDVVLQGLPGDDINCVPYSWFASMMLQSIQPSAAYLHMNDSGRAALESEFGVKPLTYDELLKAVKDNPPPTTP